jgi:hypothetical protein
MYKFTHRRFCVSVLYIHTQKIETVYKFIQQIIETMYKFKHRGFHVSVLYIHTQIIDPTISVNWMCKKIMNNYTWINSEKIPSISIIHHHLWYFNSL